MSQATNTQEFRECDKTDCIDEADALVEFGEGSRREYCELHLNGMSDVFDITILETRATDV